MVPVPLKIKLPELIVRSLPFPSVPKGPKVIEPLLNVVGIR